MRVINKYSAGDKVYWLSNSGFKSGIVKRVLLDHELLMYDGKQMESINIRYYLWADDYKEIYRGDQVKEECIFSSMSEAKNHHINILRTYPD